MATRRRFSVTNAANLFVFIFSIGVVIDNLIQNRTNLLSTFSILIRENNFHSSTIFFAVFFLGIIVPFFLYLFKLYLSMASVENHIEKYNEFIGRLSKPLLISENLTRFSIYASFLLLAANCINWAPQLLNFVLHGHLIDKFSINYNDIYTFNEINGFPSLKPLLSFNVIFFTVLLIWDLIVFGGNFKNNSASFKEQFPPFWKRFLEHHIYGFVMWASLVFLMLTKFGLLFLRDWLALVFLILGILVFRYLYTLYNSMKGLKNDFKYLFIE